MKGTGEMQLQRNHPAVGAALAGEYLGFSGEIAQNIHRHHEQADGGGFPLGLKTAQTNLTDRILFTANFVDNLLGLSGYSGESVLARVLPETFTKHREKFDPVLIDVFLDIARQPVVSRRGAVRHPIGLPAVYQLQGSIARISCRILDISATGLRIRSREQLSSGQNIRIGFVLGGTLTVNDFPVRVARQAVDDKGYVYGLQFMEEEKENGLRQRITAYLQRLPGGKRPSA
jgi:hypothetical protein